MTVQDYVRKIEESDEWVRPWLKPGEHWSQVGQSDYPPDELMLTIYRRVRFQASDLRLVLHEDGTISLIDALYGSVGSGDKVSEAIFELTYDALRVRYGDGV